MIPFSRQLSQIQQLAPFLFRPLKLQWLLQTRRFLTSKTVPPIATIAMSTTAMEIASIVKENPCVSGDAVDVSEGLVVAVGEELGENVEVVSGLGVGEGVAFYSRTSIFT